MAQLQILLSTFLLVLTVVTLVECYPGGAGAAACETLVPQHPGIQPQTTQVPYQITLSQSTFGSGDQILVTVDATPGNTNLYLGLALQARRADGSTDTTGTFTISPSDQNNFRFYVCDGSQTGAVTHSNRNDKFLPQSFLWTPSDGFTGNVQFRLTVVRRFNTFWTNIPSAVLQQVNNPPVLECPGTVSAESLPDNAGNIATFVPVCTDLDQSVQSLNLICSPSSNSFFQVGTTRVRCTCTDNQRATDTCIIIVTVTPNIENTPPDITCPGPVSVPSFEQFDGNFASWDDPTCTDVDQPQPSLIVTCTPGSGSFFQGLGTTEVTCRCTDNQGATDTCTIPVTITSTIDDPCSGNPCFPYECRPTAANDFNCHSLTGAPCPGR